MVKKRTPYRKKSRVNASRVNASRVKASIIWLHKWLGVGLALFFAMWFASGIVLYFVPFPLLTEQERLTGMAPIVLQDDCCLSAAQAARHYTQQTGAGISAARLSMYDGQPVWRVLGSAAPDAPTPDSPASVWRMVDARSGILLPALDADGAAAVAQAFSGRLVRGVERLERDQWTVPQGLNPYRPLYKVSLMPGPDGSDDGLQLYVSKGAGEVVRDTRRMERFWNWLGAVPHWIYPTVLREIPRLWHHVVVWLSIPAVFVALSGVALGIWQLFLNRSRWIPYRVFWMRWHHILGLVAAVFTFTWMLSGLFSMNPFALFSPQRLGATEARHWQDGRQTGPRATPPAQTSVARVAPLPAPVGAWQPADNLLPVQDALARAARAGVPVRELGLIHIGGQVWYGLRAPESASASIVASASASEPGGGQVLIRADGQGSAGNTGDTGNPPALRQQLPDALMVQTLTALRDTAPQQITLQQAYDGDYYAREPDTPHGRWRRPLPVWRGQWADGVRVYADPASGRVILRADASTRWQRVLYNGLHSLDFAPLIQRPLLRDVLVVGLSIVGLLMCLTACVLAWRVVVPKRSAVHNRKQRGRQKHRQKHRFGSLRPERDGQDTVERLPSSPLLHG